MAYTDQSINRNNLSYGFNEYYAQSLKLFPYKEPNNHQYQIITRILQLPDRGSILIEAPTGSGKTVASLSALIPRMSDEDKIIVVTRTVSQMEPVLREWGRIIGGFDGLKQSIKEDNPLLILPILGKARLCKQLPHIKSNMTFPDQAVHLLCHAIPCYLLPKQIPFYINKSQSRSPLLERLNEIIAGQSQRGSPSIERIYQFYAKYQSCGYFKQKEMMANARIIIVTYPFLSAILLKTLTSNLNIELKNLIMLIDEAHNLMIPKSISITRNDVETVITLFGNNIVFTKLLKLMRYTRKVEPAKIGTTNQIQLAVSIIADCNPMIREKFGISLRDLAHPSLMKMNSFLRGLNEGEIIASKHKIEIIQGTPKELLFNIYGSKLIVFQSGTFSPIEQYRSMFGFSKAELLISKDHDATNQFRCYMYYKGLTSAYRYRGPAMYKNMAEVIYSLSKHSPRHILVLCPSYKFKSEIANYLQTMSEHIIEEIKESFTDLISYHLKNQKTPQIILAIASGKLAEGVEVVQNGDSLISMVIVAGLPYTPPSDDQMIINQAMQRAARNPKIAREFTQIIPLVRKVRQAYGRTIRSLHDKGALIILDFRAEKRLYLELKLKKMTRLDQLEERLDKFFDGYQSLKEI